MVERLDVPWQMVTCVGCGKHYQCTPTSDYYNNTTLDDGVCESCLLSGKRGAAPPGEGSIGPLLQQMIDAGTACVDDEGHVTLPHPAFPQPPDTNDQEESN